MCIRDREGILRMPRYWQEEKRAHEKALDLLSIFDMQDLADHKAGSLPYGAVSYTHLDVYKRQIMSWCCKNIGIINQDGFTVPLQLELNKWKECLILPSQEVILDKEEGPECKKQL